RAGCESEQEPEIMHAQEAESEELVLVHEVADVRAREARAGGAVAVLLERPGVACKARVAEVEAAARRDCRARARRAGREDAVEHVDPTRDHLEDALRVADAHEIARLLGPEKRRGPPDGVQHLVPVLADGEASESVSVEVEAADLLDRATAELRVGASLGDAEEELAGRSLDLALPRRPEARAADGLGELGVWDACRRTDVEAHRDVGPELRLDRGCELGREASRLAVVDRAEGDAVVVDPEQRVAQGEDLEAAGVGEDRPVPACECVQTAKLRDDILAGPEVEVVGVAEDHRRADSTELVRVHALDRAFRAHGHERRRRNLAVRGADQTGPRLAVGRGDGEIRAQSALPSGHPEPTTRCEPIAERRTDG